MRGGLSVSEFSIFPIFETANEAQKVLSQLQPEGLSRLRQENRFFWFVDGAQPNNNPRVIEIKMEYYVSWAIPEIAVALWPVEVTVDMHPVWKRPVSMAAGASA